MNKIEFGIAESGKYYIHHSWGKMGSRQSFDTWESAVAALVKQAASTDPFLEKMEKLTSKAA